MAAAAGAGAGGGQPPKRPAAAGAPAAGASPASPLKRRHDSAPASASASAAPAAASDNSKRLKILDAHAAAAADDKGDGVATDNYNTAIWKPRLPPFEFKLEEGHVHLRPPVPPTPRRAGVGAPAAAAASGMRDTKVEDAAAAAVANADERRTRSYSALVDQTWKSLGPALNSNVALEKSLFQWIHCTGATGTGKSRFGTHLALQLFERAVQADPHGVLFTYYKQPADLTPDLSGANVTDKLVRQFGDQALKSCMEKHNAGDGTIFDQLRRWQQETGASGRPMVNGHPKRRLWILCIDEYQNDYMRVRCLLRRVAEFMFGTEAQDTPAHNVVFFPIVCGLAPLLDADQDLSSTVASRFQVQRITPLPLSETSRDRMWGQVWDHDAHRWAAPESKEHYRALRGAVGGWPRGFATTIAALTVLELPSTAAAADRVPVSAPELYDGLLTRVVQSSRDTHISGMPRRLVMLALSGAGVPGDTIINGDILKEEEKSGWYSLTDPLPLPDPVEQPTRKNAAKPKPGKRTKAKPLPLRLVPHADGLVWPEEHRLREVMMPFLVVNSLCMGMSPPLRLVSPFDAEAVWLKLEQVSVLSFLTHSAAARLALDKSPSFRAAARARCGRGDVVPFSRLRPGADMSTELAALPVQPIGWPKRKLATLLEHLHEPGKPKGKGRAKGKRNAQDDGGDHSDAAPAAAAAAAAAPDDDADGEGEAETEAEGEVEIDEAEADTADGEEEDEDEDDDSDHDSDDDYVDEKEKAPKRSNNDEKEKAPKRSNKKVLAAQNAAARGRDVLQLHRAAGDLAFCKPAGGTGWTAPTGEIIRPGLYATRANEPGLDALGLVCCDAKEARALPFVKSPKSVSSPPKKRPAAAASAAAAGAGGGEPPFALMLIGSQAKARIKEKAQTAITFSLLKYVQEFVNATAQRLADRLQCVVVPVVEVFSTWPMGQYKNNMKPQPNWVIVHRDNRQLIVPPIVRAQLKPLAGATALAAAAAVPIPAPTRQQPTRAARKQGGGAAAAAAAADPPASQSYVPARHRPSQRAAAKAAANSGKFVEKEEDDSEEIDPNAPAAAAAAAGARAGRSSKSPPPRRGAAPAAAAAAPAAAAAAAAAAEEEDAAPVTADDDDDTVASNFEPKIPSLGPHK